ncbi:MAG: NUDIX hydrolase [Actinomycetes bacterium]
MHVVGVLPGSTAAAFRVRLGHGEDPAVVAYDRGFVALQPLTARRDPDGELVVSWSVRPVADEPHPYRRRRGQDAALVLDPATPPVRRQRLAAYAVVRSSRGLLATEYSGRTAVAGRWGMPGGGIDPHEEPEAAVLREVAEETSQQVTLSELRAVQTSHWVGRSPRGVVEDFHAVRLVYLGSCADPTDPVVADTDGTTASARWVPLSRWRTLSWTANWRDLLAELLAEDEPSRVSRRRSAGPGG